LKKGEEGSRWEYHGGGKVVQSIQYACMDYHNENTLVLLICSNLKI
jgi:hypothetical protein